jgi:hypothetical protein
LSIPTIADFAEDAERQPGRRLVEALDIHREIAMRLAIAMIEDIKVRVSPEEKHTLRTAAMKRGVTLSEYIRDVATEAARRIAA